MSLSENFLPKPNQPDLSVDTDSQNDLKTKREKNRFQVRSAFYDETISSQKKETGRHQATPDEKKQMDANIKKLGNVLSNTDTNWQLDGAINISLIKGDYIGLHKDIDLTIDPNDLSKLEQSLWQKGYGLFLSTKHEDPTKKRMEWVSTEEFKKAPQEQLMIVAIDKQGNIRNHESLNYIDVHLIKRNPQGQPLGFGNTPLPDKWYQPQPISFQNVTINLSHPAKTAYFKIHGKRDFDQTDLENLANTNHLTSTDINDIENVINQETTQKHTFVNNLISQITPDIKPTSNSNDIFQLLSQNKTISNWSKNEDINQRLKDLSQQIAQTKDKSVENIQKITLDGTGISEEITRQNNKINYLRQKISQ